MRQRLPRAIQPSVFGEQFCKALLKMRNSVFMRDEIAALGARLSDFEFIPALSDAAADAAWTGERGFVHEVVARRLREEGFSGEMDAYSCGPPPMIDAVLPVLQMAGVEPTHIYFDKFTQPIK